MKSEQLNEKFAKIDEIMEKLAILCEGISHTQALIIANMLAVTTIDDLSKIDPDRAVEGRDEFIKAFVRKTSLILAKGLVA